MLERLTIRNFKSIVDLTLDLGRINVFIGENGCGKTNILEALAMISAAKSHALDNDELYARGVRVAKPAITFSSFMGRKKNERIRIGCRFENGLRLDSELFSRSPEDIYSEWQDAVLNVDVVPEPARMRQASRSPRRGGQSSAMKAQGAGISAIRIWIDEAVLTDQQRLDVGPFVEALARHPRDVLAQDDRQFTLRLSTPEALLHYLIYNLSTKALRGLHAESRKLPLGINGEGLDVLISQLTPAERKHLREYSHFISWLEDFVVDPQDLGKFEGHKLGKSTSTLYFKDRFMWRRNNLFSAENANEGVLHVLFYLTLFISGRTPQLFGIDNIETSLNPQLCRALMKELAALAKQNDKQALITTHNPAILDGLNLHDDEQRLFVVYRADEGPTRVRRIELKQNAEVDGRNLKLSEMWMRGMLGGLPINF
jgi:predicted ATPase